MHWITLATGKAHPKARKTAQPAVVKAPYESIHGKDLVLVVNIPQREMHQAVHRTRDISRVLWCAAAVPFLALITAAILTAKQDPSAAVTVDILVLLSGIVVILGAALFVYGQMVSRKFLSIVNVRLMLAVNEAYNVTLNPATSKDMSLRDAFITGIDNTDAVSSIWKLTIGDDFVRCWRMEA